MLDIKISKTNNPKKKPKKGEKLGFGRIFTDHMFVMNYQDGKGWFDPQIVPYQDICFSPASMVFHYGQSMFEGMKAYKEKNGGIFLFRPDMNAKRANITNERLVIPTIPQKDFVAAVKALVNVDRDWVPSDPGTSLYIRPFVIATESYIGVQPSSSYMFIIILSPVGAYYEKGLSPVNIWIEDEYVRAVRGGIGFAKTSGNYAASLKAQDKAQKEGYSQVLWLDGVERKYIEEVGAMNIFFVIDGKVVTPALSGSILPGITRDSAITLCRHFGYEVQERPIAYDELVDAIKDGRLSECFGTGTAAVVSPIGKLRFKDNVMTIGNGEIGAVSRKIYDTMTGIQWGEVADPFGWRVEI